MMFAPLFKSSRSSFIGLLLCTGLFATLLPCTVHAEFDAASTKLDFSTLIPDTLCAGGEITVCANLRQNCPGDDDQPLVGRPILFFLNSGNCGNNVGVNADDTVFTDANGNACATLTLPNTPGNYTIRVKFQGESQPGPSDPPNSACDANGKVNLSSSNECEAFVISNNYGSAPVVVLPANSTRYLCGPTQICLPVDIDDADCDIDTVITNIGMYSGTLANYDQIAKINQLGGTVVQIGGGMPGKVLTVASDFVAPVNTLSGVTVTLPNFVFASGVAAYGSFPSGIGPAQSADQLIGAPTDLTFTTPGAGGPDVGNGDGSCDFNAGNYASMAFASDITTCNGASVDLIIFTNSDGGGTATITLKRNGLTVLSVSRNVPGGTVGSGNGGVTFDLPDGFTFDEVSMTCTAGNIEVDAFAARISASSSTKDICFTADTAGVYTVIVTATDRCGNTGADTTLVTVILNRPPVADAGPNRNFFLCSLAPICFSVAFTDPDNNIQTTQLLSGPGTLSGNQICYTPSGAGTSTFIIKVTDSCGVMDQDTVNVTVSLNVAPVASNPSPVTVFQCTAAQLCNTFTATDANGGPLTWALLTGSGTITSGGLYCFTPTISGAYNAVVTVTDSCGKKDTTSITYNVTLNSAPVANNPVTPVSVFQCSAAQICNLFTATDVNGGPLTWTKLSGSGTITSGGNWCFTPSGSGAYSIVTVVTDSCGRSDTTTLTYNVTINSAPTIAFGADTSVFQCTPAQICVPYTVSDPQGLAKLTESYVSGTGSIDTLNNRICFTPAGAGSYQLIVQVNDSCGLSDRDTIVVNVTTGTIPDIACPSGPIAVSLCSAGTVCQTLSIIPPGATVTTNLGTYSGGQLCFNAPTSGTYNARVIATNSCGADTCNIVFNVTVGQPPDISCPANQTVFVCGPQNVCLPVGVMGSGVTVSVTPAGSTYGSGQVCVPVDTAGLYPVRIIATGPCGADTCQFNLTVTRNSAPVATNPPSNVDTFLCAPANICRQFTATDANGGTLTWTRLSGVGTVSASGLWCFTPMTSGVYSVVAVVADSCGAADTVSMSYTVTLNAAPSIAFGNDTTIFQCVSAQLCLPYAAIDANNNIQSISLVSGTATLDLPNSRICFTPATEGTYTFVLSVTDSCGETDRDTIAVAIDFNAPPVVNAGVDQTIFQCVAAQICLPVSASDPDNNLTTFELITGPGTLASNQICFTPSGSLNYEFVIKGTDACGLTDFDTVVVFYTVNVPPVADAGRDSTLFKCSIGPICWNAGATDANGNLTSVSLLSGPGTFTSGQICFTPVASGTYTFVLQAIDACGATDLDTAVINFTLNSAPVKIPVKDAIVYQCTPSKYCVSLGISDADNNLASIQITSGPGSIENGQWCYTPVASQVVTVSILALDSCGAFAVDTFSIDFKINSAPSISFASIGSQFLCSPQQICIPYSASDPDAPQAYTISLISGSGTLDLPNSRVCFTPATSGVYTFIIGITDSCLVTDRDTISVTVTINTPPVANAGPDQTIAQCVSGQICWPASCTDVDGNLTSCTLLSGPGTYNGTDICFTPASTGSYTFVLRALDGCFADDLDTVVINVTVNQPPVIALGNDTTIAQCTPIQICLPYTVSDPNGSARLTEVLVSGTGSIDTVLNRVCFTPMTSGSYQFIVSVSDSCGAADADTINVTVNLGAFPVISCPSGPIPVSLCTPGQVCYALGITPASAVVTTTLGTYAAGQLCFNAASSGTYNARVIATTPCGVDTCDIVFQVTVGGAPSITCPGTTNLFACAAGEQLCVPVTVMGAGATVTVSGGATYSAGTVCFNATTTGSFNFTVIASTSCGADTCSFTANVTVNSKPVAVDPATPVDTFLCAPAQICRQFTATDVNGGALTWTRLSGAGTVSATGLWCFTPVTAGAYSVVATVSDSCGAADTVTMTYNVTLNAPPTISLPADLSVAQCSATQVCVNYTVADPNNNITLETVTGSVAVTVDTVLNRFCFTPPGMGSFTFIATVTDACGLTDADTIVVMVDVNDPPVVNAGSDLTAFQCVPTQVCRTITTSDPDNNFATLTLVSGPGSLSGNNYCFTPAGSGTFTAIFLGTDSCGATDRDTIVFTITVNSAPVCNLPNDTTYFQCTPTLITRPVSASDINGNFSHCEILSGPGSLSGGNWTFTPTVDQTFFVKIQCLDSCGAACIDSFRVSIDLNTPPVANAGRDTTFFLCGDATVCWAGSCSDVDGNLTNCEILSPPGVTYSSGQICLPAVMGDGTDKSYTVVLRATDACGATDLDTVQINLNFNAPPVIAAPPSFTAFLDAAGELCFDVGVSDPDNNLSTVVVSPIGTYNSGTGQVCINVDSSGTYCLTIRAIDACNDTTIKQICVTVQIDECIHVQIEKTHNTLQGQYVPVSIYLNGSGKPLGGFDFLIAYDNSALTISTIEFGSLPVGCDWEYFTYRFGASGNCGSGCPSGLVRIVGLAETNNGAYHPSCFLDGQVGTLATMYFLVSNNRTYECQYAPIRFYWIDCGDNGLSSQGGDTLWVSRDVFDFENNLITTYSGTLPQYGGFPNSCLIPHGVYKGLPIRCVDFTNGGVDIVCADSIDGRGDVNLNGYDFEIADAVMFTAYFIKGLSAFGTHAPGSIAASDVNADGIPLSVADLVYLIRVVTGDAAAVPKLDPNASFTTDLSVVNEFLTVTRTNSEIGAIHLVLNGKVEPILSEAAVAAQMELRYEFDGTDTRVLIHNSRGNGALSTGDVLLIGEASVRSIEVATTEGQVMASRLSALPTDYALDQNYPNPFNPKTTISFALPVAGEVTLEIFNVLGQTVESQSMKFDAGFHKIEWDGGAYASGVYFYRLQADRFTETKKMVLIK